MHLPDELSARALKQRYMECYGTRLSNLSLSTTKIRHFQMAITTEPFKLTFISAHHSIDIRLSFKFVKKQIPKFRSVTSWWRHKAWEKFFKNAKFLGQFFGQNSAFELKINDILLIGNCLSFPKHPSKSRLSLLIIEIIALKDRQYWPKTT